MTTSLVSPQQLTDWLSKLVQIPSVNPTQVGPKAGIPGEARMGEAVTGWFRNLGAEVYTEEVYPNRNNVYAIWRGQSNRWAALDVHMDTVGVEQMSDDPFSGRVEQGRVYGRGAVDTKASLAVALALLEAQQRNNQPLQPNLIIAATVDEENTACAAPVFADWIRQQGIPLNELMVAEPTGCRPVYGHKGSVRVELTVEGRASHSAKPHLGKNAITAAARLIVALEEEHHRLQTEDSPLGPPTLTVSIIKGGLGANVVPDACHITVDRRMVAGEEIEALAKVLTDLARQACPLPVTTEMLGGIPAFLQAADTPWLRQLAEWSGWPPGIVPYGTNAWAYGDLPGDCVVLGPGSIDQAHGEVEWVEIDQLVKLADIYSHWWELV